MSSVDAKDRLILALDVASAEEAVHLLDRIGEAISFVKIGLELYTVAGPEMIKHARLRKKRIFLDLKFLDIEETVKRATARAAAMGIDFVTVHANRKALNAALEGRGAVPSDGSGLKLLAVTVLTNFDAADLREHRGCSRLARLRRKNLRCSLVNIGQHEAISRNCQSRQERQPQDQ